ncbi:MAG: class I SAM-dependent methyltransferase, partial [Candidatus Hodarchaeota archaeon]
MGFFRSKIRKWFGLDDLMHLKHAIIELNDTKELKKIFNWKIDPILDNPSIYEFNHIEDVNERRIRDAECLGTVICNTIPSVCLDIGTGLGYSAALMAANAPNAKVFTINIPPDEIIAGKGGRNITKAFDLEQIGSYYRERKLKNIIQILANTAHWTPDIGKIDVAFIDGCHDTYFVYNDTLKVMDHMDAGSFILWHDFNLKLIKKYHWIQSVCLGVEKLFA